MKSYLHNYMYKLQYKHVTNINNRTTQHYIQDTINAFLIIFTLLLSWNALNSY